MPNYAILNHIVSNYIILYHTILLLNKLFNKMKYYIKICYGMISCAITLHYITVHCITLHYITVYEYYTQLVPPKAVAEVSKK